jgi:PAS domain S-box-containing protein
MWGLRALPLALLVAGLLTAIGAGFQTKTLNDTKLRESFDALASRAVVQLATRISTYEYGLRGARGALVAAGPNLNRQNFAFYSQSWDLAREFPGALGYGFIRRVPQGGEAEFLAEARQDGAPNFEIVQFEPHNGERFITQYMEPEARNSVAIGRDIASDPARRDGALNALNRGQATLTGPITLLQSPSRGQTGMLFLLPIYRDEAPIRTPEERQAAGTGWVFTAFSLEDVLSDFDYLNGEFFLSIADISDEARPIPIFSSIPGQHTAAAGLVKYIPVDAYGRSWQIEIKAQSPFVNHLNLYNPLAVGLLIASLSALIASLLYIYLSNIEKALKVGLAQAHLAAIVEHSSDAIVGETPNGIVTSWNKAAEQMFGYSADDAIGKSMLELAIPPDRVSEVQTIYTLIRRGETISQFTTVRRRNDGSLFDASINISPIRSRSGEVVGAANIVRDISLEKASEARILELNSTLEQQVAARTAEVHAYSALQRAILAEAGYAIIATDTSGCITLFNPAAEAMLGYEMDEVVGHANLTIIHDQGELAARAESLSQQLENRIEPGFEAIVAKSRLGAADAREWTYVRKNRSRLPVLLSVSALRDGDGPITGHLAIAVDLTERNQRAGELARARDVAEAPQLAREQRLVGFHLLVVEDNPINQQIARELLELEGARVELANEGVEAIRRLTVEAARFDAVLMDIQMAGMDSYETVRALRSNPRLDALPIIAMAANPMIEDREASLAAGMNDHLGKPIELESLVAVLLRHCRLEATGGSALDLTAALARLGDNRALYNRLARSFLQTRAETPLSIVSFIEKDDLASIRREVHRLKSIAATLGANKLAALAAAVEHRIEQQAHLAVDDQIIAELVTEDRLLCERLASLLQDEPVTAKPALSYSETSTLLQEIRALLKKRNMRAMDLYDENVASLPSDLVTPEGGLDQAMNRLDFEEALIEVELVLHRLETQDTA